jgi:hypothetical protein
VHIPSPYSVWRLLPLRGITAPGIKASKNLTEYEEIGLVSEAQTSHLGTLCAESEAETGVEGFARNDSLSAGSHQIVHQLESGHCAALSGRDCYI